MTHRIILVDIGAGLTLTGVLPSVALNADYNARLQARGGQAPYAYTIVAGALPVGLQLDLTSGTISGTATVAGHASFTVRATDITGAHVQRVYSIRVVSEPLSISGAAPAWTVGTAYSYTYGVMHGSPPYTWSIEAGALPAGITLNASTGTISGTPTAPNAPAWTVRVTDSDGAQADLRDNATLSLIGTFGDSTSVDSYSSDLFISGGDMPYLAPRTVAGSLPAGMSLSVVGRKLRLSGTSLVEGTSTFTAAVNSSDGQTATSVQTVQVSSIGSKTIYLVHFDDTVGSFDFADSHLAATWNSLTISPRSSIALNSGAYEGRAYYAPAGSSAGGANMPYVADNEFRPGGRDFTIQVRALSLTAVSFNDWTCLFSCGFNTLYLGGKNNTTAMRFSAAFSGGNIEIVGPTIPLNVYVWWEVCRVGNTIYLFKDGVVVGTSPVSGDFAHNTGSGPSGKSNSTIGHSTGTSRSTRWDGYIDELRVIDGLGLYAGDHTPPTGPL